MADDNDRKRERDKFADQGDRWGVWVAAAALVAFLAVPLWGLIGRLIGA